MGLFALIFGDSLSDQVRNMIRAGSSVDKIAVNYSGVDSRRLKEVLVKEITDYFALETERLRNDLDHRLISKADFVRANARINKKKTDMLAAASRL